MLGGVPMKDATRGLDWVLFGKLEVKMEAFAFIQGPIWALERHYPIRQVFARFDDFSAVARVIAQNARFLATYAGGGVHPSLPRGAP